MDTVLVRRREVAYPRPPFHPPEIYPELERLGLTETDPDNRVYPLVRRAFVLLGLDTANAGSRAWNPLGDVADASTRVAVKPNFVQHYDHDGVFEQLVTHPAVVRPVLDYLLLARGTLDGVDVVDAPEIDCRLDVTLERLGWPALEALYESLGESLSLIDIRPERAEYEGGGAIVDRVPLPGDPRGLVTLDLGSASELVPIAGEGRFYGADYDRRWTNEHHTKTKNVYVVSRTFLEADLVISIPKLKTHKKAGLTAAMKNLVGINGDKNLLPHYTIGSALAGGCEYSHEPASFLQALSRRADRWYRDRVLSLKHPVAGKVYNRLDPARSEAFRLVDPEGQSKGDWWGNDVVWRMILDLNKILAYGSADGRIARHPLRRQLALVDAVVAGQGNGPHLADPAPLGAIVAGFDPVAVDTLAARLLGFDPALVPQLAGAWAIDELPLIGARGRVVIDEREDGEPLVEESGTVSLSAETVRPPAGWLGHLEAAPAAGSA